MTEKTEARQTPLPDLLDRVPDDIVLGIPGDEPMFPSYTNIPIGKMAQEAAAELRRLSMENDALGLHLSERMKDLARVEAQRDALLKMLKGIVAMWDHHCYAHGDGQPTPLHVKARAAIKAVEEGK